MFTCKECLFTYLKAFPTRCGSPAFLDSMNSLRTSEKFVSLSSTLASATPNVVKD